MIHYIGLWYIGDSTKNKYIYIYLYIIYIYNIYIYRDIPVIPARGGAEVALGLYYKTFLIYRTCMRPAPARPVCACFVRTCCAVVVQEHDLCASDPGAMQRQVSTFFTLHTALFTPRASHFALHTPHFISSQTVRALLTSSQLFSSHPIPSHMSSK